VKKSAPVLAGTAFIGGVTVALAYFGSGLRIETLLNIYRQILPPVRDFGAKARQYPRRRRAAPHPAQRNSVPPGAQRSSIVLPRSSLACWSWPPPQTKFRFGNSGRSSLHAKPLENAVNMVADRPRAAVNDLRDFRVTFALGYPGKDLALAGSESDGCKPR
jgi:hypothetical protein